MIINCPIEECRLMENCDSYNPTELNFEDICIKPTYMAKPSFGNSRNNKVLQSFSKDFKYYDWWNYLSEKEIFFFD